MTNIQQLGIRRTIYKIPDPRMETLWKKLKGLNYGVYLETIQWGNIIFIFRSLWIEPHPSFQLLRKLAEDTLPSFFTRAVKEESSAPQFSS